MALAINNNPSSFSVYYQATIVRSQAWFVVAVLKSFDHVALDRAYNVEETIFEFFVPAEMEPAFLEVMHYLQQESLVYNLAKLPNRLEDATQTV
jgi:hypothetical protein